MNTGRRKLLKRDLGKLIEFRTMETRCTVGALVLQQTAAVAWVDEAPSSRLLAS
jgi:hypothetical protein